MQMHIQKKQKPAILSQRNLDQPTVNNVTKINLETPTSATKSKQTYQFLTKTRDQRSENSMSVHNIDQSNDKMQKLIQQTLNLNLQNTILTKQLKVQQALSEQLLSQKDKLVEELHYIKKKHAEVQKQRIFLVGEVGSLRNQMNALKATLYTDEDIISNLQNSNMKFVDEINFAREMIADYKQQNTVFKAELKNVFASFTSLKQFFAVTREKQVSNFKLAINIKINEIRQNLRKFHDEINEIKYQQKDIASEKKRLNKYVHGILINNEKVRTQLNFKKQFPNDTTDNGIFEALSGQMEYKKIIENQQQKIKTLTMQITNLKKVNMQLQDQIQSNTNVQLLAPRYHTNTSYINKVMKQNQRQIMEVKEIISMKDNEIQRLKQLLDIQQRTTKVKSQEIQKLTIKSNATENNKYNQLTTQVEQLKAEKQRLIRKIDQLNDSQRSLRNDITEKDKIILNYVQKSKNKT